MEQHKYQRMDKGIKRGPNRHTAKRTKLSSGQEITEPIELREDQAEAVATALQTYVRGGSMQTVAAQYGVSRGTLYNWMLGGLGPQQYDQLVTQALVARVRKADDALEVAPDPLNIARAREMARFARMDLERRRPGLYGLKTHVTIENVTDLGEKLRRSRERTIEGECVPVAAIPVTDPSQVTDK